MEVIFKIKRSDGKFSEYKLNEIDEYTTVLEALMRIREEIDSTLVLRYSCRMAMCGSCAMKIDGKPRLACLTKVKKLNRNIIKVEPLDNYKVIRDLVPDLTPFFKKYGMVKPYLITKDITEQENPTKPYVQHEENIMEYLQFNYCIQCGICLSACPVYKENKEFLGPAAITVAYRYSIDSRDSNIDERARVLDSKNGIWQCRIYASCSIYCPKGVDPSLAIQKMKSILLKR